MSYEENVQAWNDDQNQKAQGPLAPVSLLGVHDRQKVIESLFGEMTSSSFAEGCEERIARGLDARTDAQLLELAKSKMTWTPNDQAHLPGPL
jgi:hypothetical protein